MLAVKAEALSHAEGRILDLEKQLELTKENLHKTSASLSAMKSKCQCGYNPVVEREVDSNSVSTSSTWTNKRSAEHLQQPVHRYAKLFWILSGFCAI